MPKLYKPTQLLIEVKCATLDPIDVKISCGLARTLRGIVNIYNYVSMKFIIWGQISF